MESVVIAKNGQWSLVKREENDFNSFRGASMGSLPEDKGRKGMVHGVGNARAPRNNSRAKMSGKVPTPVSSAHADRNPGVGQ